MNTLKRKFALLFCFIMLINNSQIINANGYTYSNNNYDIENEIISDDILSGASMVPDDVIEDMADRNKVSNFFTSGEDLIITSDYELTQDATYNRIIIESLSLIHS